MPVRVVVQQDNRDTWVSIGRGLVLYVCILQGSTPEDIVQFVVTVLTSVLHFDASRNVLASILETRGAVLVVPQASLAGKLKDGVPQYHALASKDDAAALYALLVERLAFLANRDRRPDQAEIVVRAGTYGNRQALKLSSPGPLTHCFEISAPKAAAASASASASPQALPAPSGGKKKVKEPLALPAPTPGAPSPTPGAPTPGAAAPAAAPDASAAAASPPAAATDTPS